MSYYARYIDIDGSYKICNPSFTDTDVDIVCNENRDQESEDPASCTNHGSRSTSYGTQADTGLGYGFTGTQYLYTDYTIPPEIQCGRISVGGGAYDYWGNSGAWNPWSNAHYGCYGGYGSYWGGCNGCYYGNGSYYYYYGHMGTIEGSAFSYGYNNCSVPIKCSEVPSEKYKEFSRIKNCQTTRCVSIGTSYYYGGAGIVCDAINGAVRERECQSEPCGADDDCMIDAHVIEKTYEVDYEVVRGAYYCLEDFEVPETHCGTMHIGPANVFVTFQKCTSDPDGSSLCSPDGFNNPVDNCKAEPDDGIAEGWTEVATAHAQKTYTYLKDTNCDDECQTCIPCDENDKDCTFTGFTNYGGYSYSYYAGPNYVLGSNCCSSAYHNNYHYWYGWNHGICSSNDGPDMKFVLVNGSCTPMRKDVETPDGGVNYGTNRAACYAAEDEFTTSCYAPYRSYTAVDECEAVPPPPPVDPPEDYEPPPPFIGECDIAGPSYSKEVPSSGFAAPTVPYHECIPRSGSSNPGPTFTTKNFITKYPKRTPLTTYEFTYETAIYSYQLPSSYCDAITCTTNYWGFSYGLNISSVPCTTTDSGDISHTACVCGTQSVLQIKMKYVPEETISTVTATASVKYCVRNRQQCDYEPPDDDDDDDGDGDGD